LEFELVQVWDYQLALVLDSLFGPDSVRAFRALLALAFLRTSMALYRLLHRLFAHT
jgi:hypothetical protein